MPAINLFAGMARSYKFLICFRIKFLTGVKKCVES
jgi:hypothetical protein